MSSPPPSHFNQATVARLAGTNERRNERVVRSEMEISNLIASPPPPPPCSLCVHSSLGMQHQRQQQQRPFPCPPSLRLDCPNFDGQKFRLPNLTTIRGRSFCKSFRTGTINCALANGRFSVWLRVIFIEETIPEPGYNTRYVKCTTYYYALATPRRAPSPGSYNKRYGHMVLLKDVV